MFWVGILLIISAGSFIYVATIHILPEVLYDKQTHSHGGHEHSEKDKGELTKYGKGVQLLVMITGLLTPMMLTFMHDD
jgi:zinc transporter 9